MKIALYHNLTSGGSKREAYEFARQLVANGHVVDLFYPSTADETFLPLGPLVGKATAYELRFVSLFSGRLPLARRYVDLAGYFVNLRRLERVARKISTDIDRGGYDWVFAHHDLIVQAPYILQYSRLPTVYYCAEANRGVYEPRIMRPYEALPGTMNRLAASWYAPIDWIKRQVVRIEDHRNLVCARLLLANSFFSAEAIYRAHAVRAQVIYLGVDSDTFRPLELEREPFVLSVGAIGPMKGYDFLIESISLIPVAHRPSLVIVGNSASKGELSFLRELAGRCQVALATYVNLSDQELVRLYNTAKAFAYTPVLEPFGFAPLEAMACGTPVVALKEGGVRESVVDGETGYLVGRDPREFAETLQRVVSDENLARGLGANGRDRVVKQWTWEHAYRRLIDRLGVIGLA